ncbi:hypothetical protein [Pelosinus sp. sgz500959]|uniref:hypothetical protein n=1 Tax=Pelosinus sp. sgz500959 TaxID=3242472 RepID=UPI00367331BD
MVNKKLPLDMDKTYTLEDLHLMRATALNRMCWRFDVSGWVGNVPNLLHEAICNIPRFMGLYNALSLEKQLIITFLCEYAGCPIKIEKIYEYFSGKITKKVVQTLVGELVQEGWLLEGDQPYTLLIVSEFKITLKAIPAFSRFLSAELPAQHQTLIKNGQFLFDLVEMAAFFYVEKPKLTAKGYLSKTVLRRLVTRLSAAATEDWEEAADENLYTSKMFMLLHGLKVIQAVQIITEQIDNRYYGFNPERWEDFIFSSPPHRLLAALCWELSRINSQKRGSFSFIARLLKTSVQAKGCWQTSTALMMTSIGSDSAVIFDHKNPFRSEEWVESVVLEPMMYLGFFEQTTEKLETPWLKNKEEIRKFWRLTSLGLALAEWLAEENDGGESLQHITNVDIFSKSTTSDFSRLFAKWQDVLPAEIEQQLIIQPDLSFFAPRYAPPYLLWILSVFGTTHIQDYVYQGNFSRDSVLRALKGGVAVSELFEVINDHCKVPPAENVIQALEHWCAAYDRTLFAKVTILSCETPEMATEIALQSKLSAYVIGQIGPQSLLVKPEGESVIRKWLEKKNWVPRPGIFSGDSLHKWLNK